MAYTYEGDLYGVAKYELTPSQFREKFVYQAILEALTNEVQSLEDLLKQMYELRSLPNSSGQQLDNIGANMGVTRRLGQTDDEYRTAIYAEIFMRRSDGSANYIMNALMSIYKSPTSKIFEHTTPMTGGVIAVVNQPIKMSSSVPILKKMAAVTIQTVAILRDPTPKGYAWVPVEVDDATSALVNDTGDWYITNGGLGVVVLTGAGSIERNKIGSFGDPGFNETPLGIDVSTNLSTDTTNRLKQDAKSDSGYLLVDKETTRATGAFGIMAEVSQLRKGHTNIEGEQ